MRTTLVVAAGTACGTALFATIGYLWMLFGADPDKDPLLSW